MAPDSFLGQVMSDASGADSALAKPAAAVLERLEECVDFEQFGQMMRRRQEEIAAKIEQLEQANAALQEQVDEATVQAEDRQFAIEQREIKLASERRRKARAEAMQRAEAAALELDDLEAAEPAPAPAPSEPEPEPEPEPAAAFDFSQPASFAFTMPTAAPSTFSSWQSHAASVIDGWEVGAVETGVCAYWDAAASWGKIKRMAAGDRLNALGIARIALDEIYVHNLQLPMDALKRWLRRGESVQFTVGVTLMPKGPQAMAVVGVGEDGQPGAPLLCQQPAAL